MKNTFLKICPSGLHFTCYILTNVKIKESEASVWRLITENLLEYSPSDDDADLLVVTCVNAA